jgi:hypothetical protein
LKTPEGVLELSLADIKLAPDGHPGELKMIDNI